jgi:hypothetical protein
LALTSVIGVLLFERVRRSTAADGNAAMAAMNPPPHIGFLSRPSPWPMAQPE